jgi:hypothetical protein
VPARVIVVLNGYKSTNEEPRHVVSSGDGRLRMRPAGESLRVVAHGEVSPDFTTWIVGSNSLVSSRCQKSLY